MPELNWDRSNPFIIAIKVNQSNIDGYGHVSTHNYVQWMIDCAFAHSTELGLPESRCVELGRGMAAVNLQVKLQGAAYEGEHLQVATWIVASDGRLRLSREFQVINQDSGKTLTRGRCDFVCTNLENGKPVRMPPEFLDSYRVASAEIPAE